MRKPSIFFLLIVSLLRWKVIFSIQCCINSNCSLTKNCSNDVSHCMLAAKTPSNIDYPKFITLTDIEFTHFECWSWFHEMSYCPKVAGGCVSVHNHSSYKTFCCAGDLCNNPQNLTCEIKNNDVTLNSSIFKTYRTTTASHQEAVSVTYIVIIVLVSALVCILVVLGLTHRIKFSYIRQLFYKRPNMMNGASYVSDRTTYISKLTNGNYSISQRNAFVNEVYKASELYEKCEKKCIGKFGEIWTGKLKVGSTERGIENVAIKIFRPRDEASWETELEMYRYIRNRCHRILTYVGCDKIVRFNEVEELWLVTQYIDHGSLHDYLSDQSNARPTWSQVLRISLDIASGLSYLHEDGSYQMADHISGKPSIAHRDLKSRNILIRGTWNACIADLGLAISFHGNPSPTDLHLQVGTQRYMAPEVLEGAINFSRDSFLGIDVYAMALILWEIFSQCVDFEGLGECGPGGPVVPVYQQPFEAELGPHITIESLQAWVVNDNKRPQMPVQYGGGGFEDGLSLWKTIVECWDRDAEARLSSSCVCGRLTSLAQSVVGVRVPATEECEPLL